MTATNVTVTELATTPSGSTAGMARPARWCAPDRCGSGTWARLPGSHPEAYVAPTAVLSGQVSVGAVLAAEGGQVQATPAA